MSGDVVRKNREKDVIRFRNRIVRARAVSTFSVLRLRPWKK